MRIRLTLVMCLLLFPPWAQAQKDPPGFDAAIAFGALPVSDVDLSPDGERVSFIAPGRGQETVLFTMGLEKGARPQAALRALGKPDHLDSCSWVANDRLVCRIREAVSASSVGGVTFLGNYDATTPLQYSGQVAWYRVVAIDRDGRNLQVLSKSSLVSNGGVVLDQLDDGSVLMTRFYDSGSRRVGTTYSTSDVGTAVDRVDTRTLKSVSVVRPDLNGCCYLSDGYGNLRIKGTYVRSPSGSGTVHYEYVLEGSQDWQPLGDVRLPSDGGSFQPLAVDHDRNRVYGMKKQDGHWAIYTVTLDGTRSQALLYARPGVDVSSLYLIGRRHRVVGISYVENGPHTEYLDPAIKQVMDMLHSALPGKEVQTLDWSLDENRVLLFASSDTDPGAFYVLDRKTRTLETFLAAQDALDGVPLAALKPVTYSADDGTLVHAYLTLPPGREDARGLPAVVFAHAGPGGSAAGGFDWLIQFLAHRGYAVLTPSYRNSAGGGSTSSRSPGILSWWPVATGDLRAGGAWLVRQGIADPAHLAILGWFYGGYLALQAAATSSTPFKAVVAVGPITDLPALRQDYLHLGASVSWLNGEESLLRDASPIAHADRFKIPVLLFHGAKDTRVDYQESVRLADRIKAAGGACQLLTWSDLDQRLEDAAARAQMLGATDAFLRDAFGLPR